jgi:hypothetical protein
MISNNKTTNANKNCKDFVKLQFRTKNNTLYRKYTVFAQSETHDYKTKIWNGNIHRARCLLSENVYICYPLNLILRSNLSKTDTKRLFPIAKFYAF